MIMIIIIIIIVIIMMIIIMNKRNRINIRNNSTNLNLSLRLLFRLGFIITKLVTHQHKTTLLPVTDDMTLLGQITLLDNAFTLVIESTQLVNDRAKTTAAVRRNLNTEPLVGKNLSGIITLCRINHLVMNYDCCQ